MGIQWRRHRRAFIRAGVFVAAVAVGVAAAGWASLRFAGWWISLNEPPVHSDLIVVLAGAYERVPLAAELYKDGYAPEVWYGRPAPSYDEDMIRFAGIPLPPQEEVARRILEKDGVPAGKIRFYGHNNLSTAAEALALRNDLAGVSKHILLVTSGYHARRARMIFRHFLPYCEIHVASVQKDSRHWWRNKDLAEQTALEAIKTAFYIAGGRFLADDDWSNCRPPLPL